MAFDAAAFIPAVHPDLSRLIDEAGAPCPIWTAANPDRALAFLFVSPSDCAAVDVLVAA